MHANQPPFTLGHFSPRVIWADLESALFIWQNAFYQQTTLQTPILYGIPTHWAKKT